MRRARPPQYNQVEVISPENRIGPTTRLVDMYESYKNLILDNGFETPEIFKVKVVEDPRYILYDPKNYRITGMAKDKRQLQTVLKKQSEQIKIYEVKEVKTKIRLQEI